ncbi:DUF5995 family protein [Kitasatospora sp. CM 4170]|uniref:DUF5995 family protein n=1 Tax=Kitasatospora aburaviensis TaxID=67265 RepID=A0ABW1ETF9_9ACTN|nr:DUF5995 family protein [Kitasatospora sp. CM 4170]WNM44714.1 DUF5995 family protein [Kitasatospora sp. CM 4170]
MPGTAEAATATAGSVAAAEHGRRPRLRRVDGAIRRLRAIGAALPAGDGVAVFNRMYLTVTEAVRDRLTRPYFADPAAMAELDAVFAGRYLLAVDAVAAGHRPPACWRPLFELRAHPGVHPLQFALAGMNAHIQHDLPLAVVDTCRRLGCAPGRLAGDYRRINGLLAGVEADVREQLMPGPDVLERVEPLTHRVGAWSVDTARDAAWASARALWELRGSPCAASALAEALDASVGLLGRALLTPLGLTEECDRERDHECGQERGQECGQGSGRKHRPTRDRERTRDRNGAPGREPARNPAAGRLPGAGNRPAVGRERRGDQAQLECSGLPSA